MIDSNIVEKSFDELAEHLAKKDISATELCSLYLDRIDKYDKTINAYVMTNRDAVLSAARESDERRASGKVLSAYDGIPIAVKDNINVKGYPTTCASKILENFISPYDSTVFAKMSAKGLILLGKTNMDEFAMGSTTETSVFGPTRNPFDIERVPGGSSGGSAAAVAARMASAALGSDTGGSIRQPAAFCGTVGVKPTYGRVSRSGLVAFASSLDQIGTFANKVKDASLLLSIISGVDKYDGTSIDTPVDFATDISGDVNGMVIGIPEEYFNGIDAGVSDAIMNKISQLEKKGARIEKVSLRYTEYAIPVYYIIATAEASSNLARFDGVRYGYRSPQASDLESLYLKSRSEGFGKEVKRRIVLGTFSLSSGYYDAYYLKALKGRKLIIDDFASVFSKVDVIMTPTSTGTAFKLGEMMNDPLQMYMSDILTISANLAGVPGISVPVGLSSEGLPIGLQIMGNHFAERKLFQAALAVEEICEPIIPKL